MAYQLELVCNKIKDENYLFYLIILLVVIHCGLAKIFELEHWSYSVHIPRPKINLCQNKVLF